MNWMQKIASKLPPTPLYIGHGYRWNPDTGEVVEEWQSGDTEPVLLWSYDNNQLTELIRTRDNSAHWSDTDDARGRIETGRNIGSIDFITKDPYKRKRIIKQLINKYPNVMFVVYGVLGAPLTIQQYWNSPFI